MDEPPVCYLLLTLLRVFRSRHHPAFSLGMNLLLLDKFQFPGKPMLFVGWGFGLVCVVWFVCFFFLLLLRLPSFMYFTLVFLCLIKPAK